MSLVYAVSACRSLPRPTRGDDTCHPRPFNKHFRYQEQLPNLRLPESHRLEPVSHGFLDISTKSAPLLTLTLMQHELFLSVFQDFCALFNLTELKSLQLNCLKDILTANTIHDWCAALPKLETIIVSEGSCVSVCDAVAITGSDSPHNAIAIAHTDTSPDGPMQLGPSIGFGSLKNLVINRCELAYSRHPEEWDAVTCCLKGGTMRMYGTS